jgi:hypothetical protein
MLLVRVFITVVAAVVGLTLGGLVAGTVGVLLVGNESYCHAFHARRLGLPAVLSVAFYIACAVMAGFFSWFAGAKWIRRFIDRWVSDNADTYIERGGARFPWLLGVYWNATWPLARLVARPEQIDVTIMGSCFVFRRNQGLRLVRRIGIISDGLEITASEGSKVVFWSFDAERLIAKVRSLGYEVN